MPYFSSVPTQPAQAAQAQETPEWSKRRMETPRTGHWTVGNAKIGPRDGQSSPCTPGTPETPRRPRSRRRRRRRALGRRSSTGPSRRGRGRARRAGEQHAFLAAQLSQRYGDSESLASLRNLAREAPAEHKNCGIQNVCSKLELAVPGSAARGRADATESAGQPAGAHNQSHTGNRSFV